MAEIIELFNFALGILEFEVKIIQLDLAEFNDLPVLAEETVHCLESSVA